MNDILLLVLALAVAALTGALVPLFLQLRKTAQAVERLADSAANDIHRVSEDVRAMRERIETLAARVDVVVDQVGTVGSAVAGVSGAVRSVFDFAIERRRSASGILGIVASIAGALVSTFLARRKASNSKGEAA